jgi:prevent-host-death family protein
MTTVNIAYARAHFQELLERASKGERITISRYDKPVADLVPAAVAEKPKPKFGTGKGKIEILDPHAFDPMTDEEVDAWLAGRY